MMEAVLGPMPEQIIQEAMRSAAKYFASRCALTIQPVWASCCPELRRHVSQTVVLRTADACIQNAECRMQSPGCRGCAEPITHNRYSQMCPTQAEALLQWVQESIGLATWR